MSRETALRGHPGPYMNDEGDVWVPRTVPYLKARQVAKDAIQNYGDRLVYEGKRDATLLGFNRDCDCDEGCELRARWDDWLDGEPEPEADADACVVPSWYFRVVEP